MKYPNVWGQGAIFSFSGLDGENTPEGSLYGTLCGDRPGISFCGGLFDLLFFLSDVHDLSYEIVASDIFRARLNGKETMTVAFAAKDAVAGYLPESVIPHIVTDIPRSAANGCSFYHTDTADYCFLRLPLAEGSRFVLTVSADSGEEAERRARCVMKQDIGALAAERLAFYDSLPEVSDMPEAQERTLAKCFSVMRSQVYTATGRFSCRWTTPDRFPHKYLWLWDSVFHSLGNIHISPGLAKETLLAVLAGQTENGFIPHRATPDGISSITQAPVLAWGFLNLYKQTEDIELLRSAYEPLRRYLLWNRAYRDAGDNELYEWLVNPNQPNCRCDESGMDNSPRFDDVEKMDCIDFSCFMANDVLAMSQISAFLRNGEEAFWRGWYTKIRDAVNVRLWDEEDGLYYDRVLRTDSLKKVKAVSCFLPLFAGICSSEQAKRLVEKLKNPSLFGTPFGIPSIARDDATYGTDMWRGPVWINYNYMIACGLQDYGYCAEAEQLLHKTLEVMAQWYEADGVIYEFYDPENRCSPRQLFRKGAPVVPYAPAIRMQTIRDYGWSATLYAAIAMELYGKKTAE